jgi:predicted cupin superfamily sugar epimerase
MSDSIERIVELLRLAPHPEGGFYRETYRSELSVAHPALHQGKDAERSAATCMYYLLPADDFSAFHRVVATDEIWHLYAGDPLELHLIHQDGRYERRLLTTDLLAGEPTTMVEAGCWQAARVAPGGAWSFGGCTVAPGFDFADLEMSRAEEIIRQHPEHEAIIRQLTKS